MACSSGNTRIGSMNRLPKKKIISAPSASGNDIDEIGGVINDLAANLQEVLLHVWHHTTRSMALIDGINKNLMRLNRHDLPQGIAEDVEGVRQNIQEMQDLVRAFEYYDIQLEDGRILAAEARPDHPPSHHRPCGDLEDRSPRWDLENSK